MNFLMDFIVLFITNKICKYTATCHRVVIAATFGALWGTFSITIPANMKIITNLCTYIPVSFIMIRICMGKNKFRDIFKGVLTLYVITFMLGGILHFLYYYTYAGYLIKQIVLNDAGLFVFIIVSLILLMLLYAQLVRIKVYADKKCSVCCVIDGKKIEMTGIVDTGNILKDPFSHKPVCIAQKECFKNVLNEINDFTKVKYHYIPFNSVGCKEGLLEVITVDTMYICNEKEKKVIKDTPVGLSSEMLSSQGEYSILVNPEVV